VSILIDRLRGVSNWAARFAIVDEALLGRLRAARCTVSSEVMWAWKRIVSSAGQIDIGALAGAADGAAGILLPVFAMPWARTRRRPPIACVSVMRKLFSLLASITAFAISH
jgi:hypothetical protein